MEADVPREVGPWGGNTGKGWDDGAFNAIKQIDVHVGNDIVRGIQVSYEDGSSNTLVEANKRGGKGGTTIYRVIIYGLT